MNRYYNHPMQHFMSHPDGLLDEIDNSNHWGSNPIRTDYSGSAHAEIVDILLRGPDIEHETNLAVLHQDIHCMDYDLFDQFPVVRSLIDDVMKLVKGEELGRVILTRLAPNGVIYPHVDEGAVPEYYKRYHYCIHGGEGNWFLYGKHSTVESCPGFLYELDVTQNHAVVNMMDHDRVHLIMDIHS
jgi:hypothetical protein